MGVRGWPDQSIGCGRRMRAVDEPVDDGGQHLQLVWLQTHLTGKQQKSHSVFLADPSSSRDGASSISGGIRVRTGQSRSGPSRPGLDHWVRARLRPRGVEQSSTKMLGPREF